MPRPRHPKKEVEEAIRYAEARGWRIDVGGSHAKQLRRVVDNCAARSREEQEDNE